VAAPNTDEPDRDVDGGHNAELAVRLERTFRLLGRRIYWPSLRGVGAVDQNIDRASVPVLGVLEMKGDLRPSDLAAALELDPSTVSRQLRQLEDLQLVHRTADQSDGRASRIGLTDEGRAALNAVRIARAALLEAVLVDWSETQRQQLHDLLDHLSESLERT
jgi:DNA-binding MarR family transcriptional regulator